MPIGTSELLRELWARLADLELDYAACARNVSGPLSLELAARWDEEARALPSERERVGDRLRALDRWVPLGAAERSAAAGSLSRPAPTSVREMAERLSAAEEEMLTALTRLYGEATEGNDGGTAHLAGELLERHGARAARLRETLAGRAPGLEHRLAPR